MINATKNIFDKFDIVSSETDRNAAFNELARGNAPIAVVTDDELTFIFHLSRYQNNILLMAPVESPRALVMDENAFIIFSISTGQYALKGPLKLTREGIVAFMTNTELRRLQRRKDFRINTLHTKTLSAFITVSGQKTFTPPVVDISAGGMAFVLPKKEVCDLKDGEEFKCQLSHPDRKIDEIQGIIRHLDTLPKAIKAGVEFLNLTGPQKTSLLALSLQMHRENSSKIDI
jgi:c-di-GMP-binding flagellar brake protein YcgR